MKFLEKLLYNKSMAMNNSKKITINDSGIENYLITHNLNISFDDLKASNFLYKNGFYPQAIFYLQQSIEKLIKSNGYYLNIIKDRKIGEKNVRHDVWKVYCNILENLSNSKFEKIFNKERQKEIINNSPVLKFLFDKYKKDLKLRRKNFHYLNYLLSDEKNIKKIKQTQFPDEIIIKTLKQHSFLKEDLLVFMDNINWQDEDNFLTKFGTIFGILGVTAGIIYQQFSYPIFSIDISIILSQHVEISRYGIESHRGKLPVEIYTEEYILIKEFEKIYAIISNMQKVYSKLFFENND